MKTTAVVLGRNYTSRLGMIRAAGMQDCDVIVVRTANRANTEEYDRASRYVRGYHAVDEQEKDRLLEVLMGLEPCSGGSGKMVLLPTDDVAASFVDTHLNELMTKFHCPHVIGADPLEGAAVRFMDKRFQKGLAAEAGLKSAKGWTLEFDGQNYTIPEDIVFPCFVKPQTSIRGIKKVMRKCSTREELEKHLEETAAMQRGTDKRWDLLVEEFIRIEREFDLPGYANGEDVVFPVFFEKGLIHLGVTGTATLIDSGRFEEARDALVRMASRLNFTGLIDVEMFESGGEIYFNEMNLRLGASGFGLTGYGINLPGLFIRTVTGLRPEGEAAAGGTPAGSAAEIIAAEYADILPIQTRQFASEKVIFQEYKAGAVSWKEYNKIIDDADFNFIRAADDPGPYTEFSKTISSVRWKVMVRRFLKKLRGK
ncbi:MAG: ATP-grasp domain-containing protein [Lachnospiraceae bacterium]|nr:ATP-grasp domain-containing protein [Lachnospiraceae bacterium]